MFTFAAQWTLMLFNNQFPSSGNLTKKTNNFLHSKRSRSVAILIKHPRGVSPRWEMHLMIKWKLHNLWTHLSEPTHLWPINKQSAVAIANCCEPIATTSRHLTDLSQHHHGPVFQNCSLRLSLPWRSSSDAGALQESGATVYDWQGEPDPLWTRQRLVCKSTSKRLWWNAFVGCGFFLLPF